MEEKYSRIHAIKSKVISIHTKKQELVYLCSDSHLTNQC